jgi:hypothetical protein
MEVEEKKHRGAIFGRFNPVTCTHKVTGEVKRIAFKRLLHTHFKNYVISFENIYDKITEITYKGTVKWGKNNHYQVFIYISENEKIKLPEKIVNYTDIIDYIDQVYKNKYDAEGKDERYNRVK